MASLIRAWLPTQGLEAYSELDIPGIKPVSEAEEQEASDFLEEVSEERDDFEVSLESYDRVQEELLQHARTASRFIGGLQYGLEHNDLSKAYAATAQSTMHEIGSIFDVAAATPALEDYTADQLDAFYTVSLEGFSDILRTISEKLAQVTEKTREFVALLGVNDKAAKALHVKADALHAQLDKVDVEKEVELKKMARLFNFAGKVPTDIAKAAIDDVRSVTYLATKHLDNQASYHVQTVDKLADILNVKAGATEKMEKFLDQPTPNMQIPEPIASGKALLGKKILVESFSKGRLLSKTTESFVWKLRQERKLFQKVNKKVEGKTLINRQTAESLIKTAKAYASVLELLNREAKRQLYRQVTADRKLVEAGKKHGITTSHGLAVGPRGELMPTVTTVVDQSPHSVIVRSMGEVAQISSSATLKHFAYLSRDVEAKANACLTLAKMGM